MVSKSKLVFREEARSKIMEGVEILYDAVSTTLGPRGQNVALAKANNGEVYLRNIIHDGVGVAKSIDLEDEFANMGAQVLREASYKTVDEVGDGTTLTIVLSHAILSECMKIIATGVNPMTLRSGLETGRDRLVAELEHHSHPIKTLEEEIRIATISAADPELGKIVGETLHKMGPDGVVTIQESKSSETIVKYQSGMQLDSGYMHPLFMTNPEELEATIENPYILITDKEVNVLSDMTDLLTEIHNRGAGLVVISPVIGGEALPLLIQNKISGQLLNLAVKAPSFGEDQKAILQDIAILTGGTFITEDAAWNLADVKLSDLGRADYVKALKSESLIVGGKGKKKDIDARVASIKKAIEKEDSDFNKAKYRARLGKLTNGVAVIEVGGFTEIEMVERKERVDDAVHATRAAMRNGIIPGGEIIFLRIREKLGTSLPDQILYRALERPFNKLVANAGVDPGEIREQLRRQQLSIGCANYGFDVTDLEFKDMMSEGIVDPVLVAVKALENAVSVAIALMSTGALIVPVKEKKGTDPRGLN